MFLIFKKIFFKFQIPAVVVIIPALNTLGRVKCYCGTFLGGAVCCGVVAIITFCVEKGGIICCCASVFVS
jgi:hypothetical protein